jgi:D-glycero-D-manno-heptose 1,7-bisphosphate phosphatase
MYMIKKALFLDRDGVINVDHGYVHRIEDFHFVDGVFELTRLAQSNGYVICVITNQAGIARGYYSESDFEALTNWMCCNFKAEGVVIDKVYYSPYHPIHGLGQYKKDDISRKPNPGMLHKAESELNLDLTGSVLIGDSVTDIQAGFFAGVGPNLYLGVEDIKGNANLGTYHSISHLNEASIYL